MRGDTTHTACSDWQPILVDVLFGDADPAAESALHEHMESCQRCRDEFASLSETLEVTSGRGPVEFAQARLDDLEARILRQTSAATLRPIFSRPATLHRLGGWGLRLAAVFVLIATGVIIGKNLPDSEPEAITQTLSSIELTPVESRAYAYLDRSKTLLLGVVNFDGAVEDPASLNLPQRSRIAHELLQEAAYLKTGLSDTEQQRLRALVTELELILLQLANLEAVSNVAEIEIVQAGMDQNAILFKIDVEKMRHTEPDEKPTVSTSSV